MKRDATHSLTRRLIIGFVCAASLLLTGCGGGGGGGSDGSSSSGKATIRFMQAGAELGTSQFTVNSGTATSVAFRELSAGISVDAGTMTLRATAPGTTVAVVPLTLTLNEGDTGIVVLNQRENEAPRLVLAGTLGTGSASSTVAYANFTPFQPILDVYVLTGSQTLAAATPVATGLRTNEVTSAVAVSGTYQVVATTPGRKDRIVYQSGNLTPVSGSPTILLGAQWTNESLQPLPVAVSRSGTSVANDSRPLVRVLNPLGIDTTFPQLRLYVDCDQPVAVVPFRSAFGPLYRVTPGTRSITPGCGNFNLGTTESVFLAETGKEYIQPFGPSRVVPNTLEIQSFGWIAPRVTTDFPVPANKARIRIVVNNTLRPGDIYVNNVLVEANVGIKELVVDIDPGVFFVKQLMPVTGASEGSVGVIGQAGHFYLVEIGHFATADELANIIYPDILAGRPVERLFLVNGDDPNE
jgi:hypothetical protein